MVVGYIFGYGSLAHPEDWAMQDLPAPAIYGYLQNHRRTWAVAFDNASPLYDHKHYKDKGGKRFPFFISALGVYRAEGGWCSGLAMPVTAELLGRIDKRELSYTRKDVSDFWEGNLDLPIWTYYPKEKNMLMYKDALPDNRVVLPRRYFDICQGAFQYWGGEDDFSKSTDKPTCPVVDMIFWRAPGAV